MAYDGRHQQACGVNRRMRDHVENQVSAPEIKQGDKNKAPCQSRGISVGGRGAQRSRGWRARLNEILAAGVDDLDFEPLFKLLMNPGSLIRMRVRTAHHLFYHRLRIDR
jgi:hypothetical protein